MLLNDRSGSLRPADGRMANAAEDFGRKACEDAWLCSRAPDVKRSRRNEFQALILNLRLENVATAVAAYASSIVRFTSNGKRSI